MYENGTMRPAETVLRMGEERIKENDRGDEINEDILYIFL
jgi:hypothetical protein